MKIKALLLSLGLLLASPTNLYAEAILIKAKKTSTEENYLENVRARAGYEYQTRTSNKRGSERDRNTQRNSAVFGANYRVNNNLKLDIDGSLNHVGRIQENPDKTTETSDYTSLSIGPGFNLETKRLLLSLRTQYNTKDSQHFEVSGEREPSLSGSLEALIALTKELELRTGFAGRTRTNKTTAHAGVYGGLGRKLAGNLYGDAGVAYDENEFYNQNTLSGVLGLETRGASTRIRGEFDVGERLSARLSVETPLNNDLALMFRASASREEGDVRSVDSVSAAVNLVGRRW